MVAVKVPTLKSNFSEESSPFLMLIKSKLEESSDSIEEDPKIQEDYSKLNDKCEVVIKKIKTRKKK